MAEKIRLMILRLSILILLLTAGCYEAERGQDSFARLQRLVTLRGKEVKTYYTVTKDGWHIAVHRLQAPPKESPVPPVILCHGLGLNSQFWRLNDDTDLARFLRNARIDVWLLDLRGSGFSTKPAWQMINIPDIDPEKLFRREIDKLGWTMDDNIIYDVPAAIDLVLKETGAKKVIWVGHSLGAMVILGYLERFGDEKIHGVVALAPSMVIPQPPNNIMRDMKFFRLAMATINNRFQALAGVVTLGQIKSPVDILFYNAENVELPTLTALFLNASENVSPPTIDQLLKMVETGELVSADGKFNYSKSLDKIKVPILLIAGKVDNMASPEAVRYVYRAVSSTDKQIRVFGLANGDSIDYGHDDLVIGKRAKKEVFPVIRRWILAHPAK